MHIYPPMKTFSQQTTPVPTQTYLTHFPVTEAPHLPIQVHLAHLHIYCRWLLFNTNSWHHFTRMHTISCLHMKPRTLMSTQWQERHKLLFPTGRSPFNLGTVSGERDTPTGGVRSVPHSYCSDERRYTPCHTGNRLVPS